MDAIQTRHQDDADKRSERMRIQRDMLIYESDLRKLEAKQKSLDIASRQITSEKKRLKVEEENIHKQSNKVENEIRIIADELARLRKKMNLI